MTSASIDRRLGLSGNTAVKTPVTVVSTSNITLSGEQTIDGVAVKAVNAAGAPDRVLCTGQTTTSQNGIWDVNTGAWTRSRDANGNYDLVNGSQVVVAQGSAAKQVWILTTADPITIGTTGQTWSQNLSSGFLATLAASGGSSLVGFIQAGTGAVARTAQAKMREWVSVADFGAVGDNSTNDTAAVQAAVDAVAAAGGGTVYFPATAANVYLCNINITTDDITLMGQVGRIETYQTGIRAASNATATITVGDGTTLVYGNLLHNLSICGTTKATTQAPAAVRYKSAYNCFANNVTCNGGQKTLHFEGSATQPVTCIYWTNFHIRADWPDAACRGIYVSRHAGSYTTGITFTGGHINGQNFGYLCEIDGEQVYFVNVYTDIFVTHGFYITTNGGNIVGQNLILDSPAGVVVTVSENVRNLSRYITGYVRSDVGTLQYLDLTTTSLSFQSYSDTAHVRNITSVGDIYGANVTLSGWTATSVQGNTLNSAGVNVTITPTKPISFVSNVGSIQTITVPAAMSANGGWLTLIPTGAWTLVNTGNIAVAATAVVSKAMILFYDAGAGKWYPSYT